MTEHYIDGERFTQLAREGEATPEIIEMFYTLADKHYSRHPIRNHVMDRLDAKQEAVMRCLPILADFKTKVKGAAYNYFRSVVHHLFCDIVLAHRRSPAARLTFMELTDVTEDYRSAGRKRYRWAGSIFRNRQQRDAKRNTIEGNIKRQE